MRTYNVIEDCGYGIKYTVFTGNYDECSEWINTNTVPHWLNSSIRIIDDEEHRNGNGYPFYYTIELDEE